MGFKLSQQAEADLIEIYRQGTLAFSITQADAYFDRLTEALRFLGERPRAARERAEITPPVRCHPHASHLIIYLIDGDRDALILRIRHAHEDWETDEV